jgi:hypothetical protein
VKLTSDLVPGDIIRHRHNAPFQTVLFVQPAPHSPTTLRVHVSRVMGLPSAYWANPDDEWEVQP